MKLHIMLLQHVVDQPLLRLVIMISQIKAAWKFRDHKSNIVCSGVYRFAILPGRMTIKFNKDFL